MHSLKHKKGFSLIEMLVYVTLLIVVSVLVVVTVLSLAETFSCIRLSRAIETSAITSLERMVRDIRDADNVSLAESTLGTSPGVLTLVRSVGVGVDERIEFYVDSGTIRVRRDGVDEGALTGTLVSVDSLIFNAVSNDISEGVRIELELGGTQGAISLARSFDLFAVLRGSYQNE